MKMSYPDKKEGGMTLSTKDKIKPQKKWLHYENGRTYFTRESERKLFFILTVFMLVSGILMKAGLF